MQETLKSSRIIAMNMSTAKISFFGGEPLGAPSLKALYEAGIIPTLIVASPDKPSGRGQHMTAPPVKEWALAHNIEVLQPQSYKSKDDLERIIREEWDLFVVVAYNYILPKWFLEIPKHGVINVHPSLLPKLRGASPIRTAILEDKKDDIGISIMLMDEKMDHGPILKQEKITMSADVWPIIGPELDTLLAKRGGELLAETIPLWLAGECVPQDQNHDEATYTKRFTKDDTRVEINPLSLPTNVAESKKVLCKINAFLGIGDAYFEHDNIRVKVKQAKLADDGSLRLLRVTPAGKPEMDFDRYLRSINS